MIDKSTVEDWTEILKNTPSPTSAEVDYAHVILNELNGYRRNSTMRETDAHNLAQAMIAYARCLQEFGLKV